MIIGYFFLRNDMKYQTLFKSFLEPFNNNPRFLQMVEIKKLLCSDNGRKIILLARALNNNNNNNN